MHINIILFLHRGIVFSNANKRWKKTRAAVLNILAPRRVEEFKDVIVKEADRLIETLLKDTENSGSVNPTDYLNITTMNVILQTTYGKNPITKDDPFYKELISIIVESVQLSKSASDITTILPFLSFFNVFSKKRQFYKQFIDDIHHPFYQKLVDDAVKSDKDSFMKKLVALKDEYDLDNDSIVVIGSDLMGAGNIYILKK